MHPGSRLVLSGFLLLAALLVVEAVGPLTVWALPFVLVVAGLLWLAAGDGTGDAGRNCADCGARNGADAEACEYCGSAL